MNKLSTLILFLLIFSFLSPVSAEPVGYLVIPKIALYKSIEHISDSDVSSTSHFYDLTDLYYGVGHLAGTSWGTVAGGRTILVGHTPGAFSDIRWLEIGDEIILGMGEDYYAFSVYEIYLMSKTNDALFVTVPPSYELVLVTCTEEENTRLVIKAK